MDNLEIFILASFFTLKYVVYILYVLTITQKSQENKTGTEPKISNNKEIE